MYIYHIYRAELDFKKLEQRLGAEELLTKKMELVDMVDKLSDTELTIIALKVYPFNFPHQKELMILFF